MIKKYILKVFYLFIGLSSVNAQRMIPKKKGVEIGYSQLSNAKIGNDYAMNLGLIINGKNGNYQLWNFEYSHQYFTYNTTLIPHETYTIEGGNSFFLLGDNRRMISLNLALTAVVGYETINHGESKLNDGAIILNENNFIYGAGSWLTFETYFTDKFVFILKGQMKLVWGTDVEQLRPSVGIGMRFNF
ncbi:conjugal transfer protein TraO [Empedobacter brevis]|uniref:conjugal transfer protein TraO n=1 Tax=Empedobacter brevis TaxID=247 RepID=UPI00289FDF97|nr:conjugal transfer protein TraO [Empedobacter brevis]